MKPRDFLNFFKTKSGKIVVFGALFAGALMILSVVRKHHTSAEDAIKVTTLATNVTDKPQVAQSVTRPMQVFNPPPEKSQPVIYSPSSRPAFQNSSALPTRLQTNRHRFAISLSPTVRREIFRLKN